MAKYFKSHNSTFGRYEQMCFGMFTRSPIIDATYSRSWAGSETAKKAKEMAHPTLERVQQAVGLLKI